MKFAARFVLALITFVVIAAFFSNSVVGQASGPHFGPWSTLEPVTAVNTDASELPGSISHDGLRLYFNRTGNIWVSHRETTDADWQPPVMLSDTINTVSYQESAPFESIDGHWLYFGSNRPGGLGDSDIWVSWRKNTHDDAAWEAPINVSSVNSNGFENAPMLVVDDDTGTTQMYLAACPGGTQACNDIYVSTLGPTGFGSPVLISEVSSPTYSDGKPWVRHDGLEMFFGSYRLSPYPPQTPPAAVYVSTRSSTTDPWLTPVIAIPLGQPGEPGARWMTAPVLSRDGTTLYVAADRPGSPGIGLGDIYVTHRKKVTGRRSFDLAPFEPARSYRLK